MRLDIFYLRSREKKERRRKKGEEFSSSVKKEKKKKGKEKKKKKKKHGVLLRVEALKKGRLISDVGFPHFHHCSPFTGSRSESVGRGEGGGTGGGGWREKSPNGSGRKRHPEHSCTSRVTRKRGNNSRPEFNIISMQIGGNQREASSLCRY